MTQSSEQLQRDLTLNDKSECYHFGTSHPTHISMYHYTKWESFVVLVLVQPLFQLPKFVPRCGNATTRCFWVTGV